MISCSAFTTRTPPAPLAPIGLAALMLCVVPGVGTTAILAGLATCAVIVAAVERRYDAMMYAAAIALALGPVGLLTAPIALGLCCARGRWRSLPVAIAAGLATAAAIDGWATGGTIPTLLTLALRWPGTLALVVASGCAAAAWLAASASTRWPDPAGLLHLSIVALATGAIFIPVPVASIMLPALLVAAWRPSRALSSRAANDDQVVRSTIRLAA